MKLYVNLINFNSDKLAGVGYFFKRIISNIDFEEEKWKIFDEIILLSNCKIDLLNLFSVKNSDKIRVVKLPFVHNILFRILFEQLILPFCLIKNRNVFYSPTPSVPLFAKIVSKNIFLISTIHDMIPFKIENKYSFLRSVYIKILSKKSAQISDRVITVSEFSKQDIAVIANIEPSKIDVVYNFIPEFKHTIDHNSLPYFITVCTIEPGKNIENMIIGFSKFIKENRDHDFYKYKIVGQFGWNYNSIISLAKSLGIEDKVEFTGYLSDSEKNKLLENCTGMIYLSMYEGFGIPPLEAMYFDKISIVSNTSSLPEVVGDAGIIQDPNDTDLLANNLKRLIDNSEDFKINIKRQLSKFKPEDQILKFSNIIISSSF
ncbi:glycosyltransferase family 4 protein [Flavobacterium gawalongense]|uniref:Glycosyltransferase family 4 protein n=1 Tax=Flavobacterium gawalongense TaxID=2594432 RepID=A0A553BZ08_9FLAO|nr:glycosyltransferase family 1 protein [Flavobacterium gawalongense]TRX13396.1 glycosyltransferase family 4 protein [Flavobacterium gawalongense]TRX15674.1 glycosyltransferase family 4 protein [Flavobacterium gawalongense]TRX31512.1 glycosyltransferase family 4 protein [Flavobacterium gawalongense]